MPFVYIADDLGDADPIQTQADMFISFCEWLLGVYAEFDDYLRRTGGTVD